MFVELFEYLRCPNRHPETALIASATRTEARHIVDGVLGCPVCRAEFPIMNGVARFAAAPLAPPAVEQPSPDDGMRVAAFLELTDTHGFALLAGRWGAQVDQIQRISNTPVVVVNPAGPVHGEAAGVLIVSETVPLAAESARGAALDETTRAELASSMVRAVRLRGRVMGPVALPLPSGLAELSRDARHWVAEKNVAPDSAPRLTPLSRAKR